MTGTNCDLFTHSQSRSYLNHLVNQKNKIMCAFIVVAVYFSLFTWQQQMQKHEPCCWGVL
jgi:hypothetical protein